MHRFVDAFNDNGDDFSDRVWAMRKNDNGADGDDYIKKRHSYKQDRR